ncbi:hypothetical protein AB6D11_19245 [Vibrio splendidus]
MTVTMNRKSKGYLQEVTEMRPFLGSYVKTLDSPIFQGEEAFALGVYFGFPPCCAAAYSLGWNGIHSGRVMGLSEIIYVPCPKCIKVIQVQQDPQGYIEVLNKISKQTRVPHWPSISSFQSLDMYMDSRLEMSSSLKSSSYYNSLFSDMFIMSQQFKFGPIPFLQGMEFFDCEIKWDNCLGPLSGERNLIETKVAATSKISGVPMASKIVYHIDGFTQLSMLTSERKHSALNRLLKRAGLKKEDVVLCGSFALQQRIIGMRDPCVAVMAREPANISRLLDAVKGVWSFDLHGVVDYESMMIVYPYNEQLAQLPLGSEGSLADAFTRPCMVNAISDEENFGLIIEWLHRLPELLSSSLFPMVEECLALSSQSTNEDI